MSAGTTPPARQEHALDVVPTSAALGAEIRGVDLGSINHAIFEQINRAWLDHSVLLFRNQRLSDDELIAFSCRFGTLDHAPIQENGRRFVEGHPEIYVYRTSSSTASRSAASVLVKPCGT